MAGREATTAAAVVKSGLAQVHWCVQIQAGNSCTVSFPLLLPLYMSLTLT
jgi:hypothetical protein